MSWDDAEEISLAHMQDDKLQSTKSIAKADSTEYHTWHHLACITGLGEWKIG